MRVLIISREAEAACLAHRLVRDGHAVDMWTQKPEYRNVLRGIVNRVSEWRPRLASADLVVVDTVGYGHLSPVFAARGKPVIACNSFADAIELDRVKGMAAMKAVGIEVPPTRRFSNPSQAKALLKDWSNPLGYVAKPCGNLSPGSTYLCPTKEIFEWAIGTYESDQEMIVQDVVDGVEISTEGWFNGRDWIWPINHTMEEKRLFPHAGAPMTGCMGNVVFAPAKPSRLAEATVMKMTNALKLAGYRGPLDVNAIVTKDCAYGLEFTARFGYDALEALVEGLQEPVIDVLFETALGAKKEMKITSDYMMAVRVTQPPFPDEDEEQSRYYRGSPVTGITELDEPHVLLCDVERKDGKLVAAGADGLLAKCTAFGRTVQEARKRVYKTAGNLRAVDLQYRTDIGARVDGDLGKLKEWGWIA